MTQINISLPYNLIIETKKHAEKNGKTFSGMVRVGLEKQLNKDSNKYMINKNSIFKENCPQCGEDLNIEIFKNKGEDNIIKHCKSCLWSG